MKTVRSYKKMKKQHDKIVMMTAYDYPSGRHVEAAEADIILVGDSLGMVVLGYPDTLNVTVADIIHHTKATRRGAADTFIVADMPFGSYHISLEETKKNAFALIREANANAVKLEGGKPSRLEAIKAIVDCEIPVCAHLGLTPQSINAFGGYQVQGKKPAEYDMIMKQAKAIEEAGAFMLVLEGIPEQLGKEISEGQVLVYHDLLGMADFVPKFVKAYDNLGESIPKSLKQFTDEVKKSAYPAKEHVYLPIE